MFCHAVEELVEYTVHPIVITVCLYRINFLIYLQLFHLRFYSIGTPVETESDAQRIREEVNCPINELCLDNPHFGPLVLPGPSRPFSDGMCVDSC